MSTSAFVGMFSQSLNVPFQCSTGNCTWPEYTSLAVCNSCTNQTADVVADCTGPSTGYGLQNCTYTFPDGSSVGAFAKNEPGPQETAFSYTLLNSNANNNTEIEYDRARIANVSAVWFPIDNPGWELPPPVAFTCELSFCRKVFSATLVKNGVLEEPTTLVQALTFPPCGENEDGEYSGPPTICPGFPNGQVPSSYNSSERYTATTLPDWTAVWVNNADISNVHTWAENMFTVSTTTSDLADDDTSSNIVPKMLWNVNNGNISQTFDNIAAAMSRQIRMGPNETSVVGPAQTVVPYIRVRWAWISLPVALVVLSVAFLIVSVAFSSEAGQHVWKSSSLVTLFHRLEACSPDELALDSTEEMEYAGKAISVILGRDVDGHISLLR